MEHGLHKNSERHVAMFTNTGRIKRVLHSQTHSTAAKGRVTAFLHIPFYVQCVFADKDQQLISSINCSAIAEAQQSWTLAKLSQLHRKSDHYVRVFFYVLEAEAWLPCWVSGCGIRSLFQDVWAVFMSLSCCSSVPVLVRNIVPFIYF